jgi:hypothetical protein
LDIKTKKYTKRKTELKFHYSISDQFQNNLAPFVNFQNSRIPELAPISKRKIPKRNRRALSFHRGESTPKFLTSFA